MAALEDKYDILRKKLNSAGYHHPLSFGSMDLVHGLLNDIILYKNGNASFRNIANEILEQLNIFKLDRKPLIQEFRHLRSENNDLNLPIILEQGNIQVIHEELKEYISTFKKAYFALETANLQHLVRIGELEDEISHLNKKLIKFEGMTDFVKEKKNIKESKFSLNEDERTKFFVKIAEENKTKIKSYHKSTQTKLKSSRADKRADLKNEIYKQSCQTIREQHCDCKSVGKLEEQYKQTKFDHLSPSHEKNGEKDITPSNYANEKIKAERDYYCKEYNYMQERIFHLFVEHCSPMEKEQLFCMDSIKDCRGVRLRLLINKIGKLLRCKKAVKNIKDSELQDMVLAHQRERVVLLLRCERVEQKLEEIKKHYKNLSSENNKMLLENNNMQECLRKKDEELKNMILTHQKTEVKLNNALLNLVAMSSENDCLKDKIKQKEDYIIKIEKNVVSIPNCINTWSELEQGGEAGVSNLRKKAEESENEMKNLKQQLCRSTHEIDRITKENKHLVLTVTKLNKHIRDLHQNLDLKKQRIKDLKREIHNYISEVRKVEEAIESKEQDFQRILEIYSVMSEEAFSMGNKHHISETDGNSFNEEFEKKNFGLNNLKTTEHNDD